MRSIVTDGVAGSVCRSVCHDHEPRKTAEPIEMPFGLWTWLGQRNRVLYGGPDPPYEEAILRGGEGADHYKV